MSLSSIYVSGTIHYPFQKFLCRNLPTLFFYAIVIIEDRIQQKKRIRNGRN